MLTPRQQCWLITAMTAVGLLYALAVVLHG